MRTFSPHTKDNEATNIKQVEIVLEQPMNYMDNSVHSLESIDLELDKLTKSLNVITEKISWYSDLREAVLKEAQKVKLKE